MQEKHGGIKEYSMDKAWSKYGMNGLQVFLGLEDKYYKKYKRNMKDIKYQVDVDIKINKNGIIFNLVHRADG